MAALMITDDGDRATITVAGVLDSNSTLRLVAQLQGLMATGIKFLLLDLTKARDYHPSVGGLLTRIQAQLRERGGLLATEGADAWLDADLTSATLVEVFALYQRLRSEVDADRRTQPA